MNMNKRNELRDFINVFAALQHASSPDSTAQSQIRAAEKFAYERIKSIANIDITGSFDFKFQEYIKEELESLSVIDPLICFLMETEIKRLNQTKDITDSKDIVNIFDKSNSNVKHS